MNNFNKPRIEICGGIASGKTSLANLLKNINVEPICENFQINPFWQAFYENPSQYAFETEITFLLQHYHQIKAINSSQAYLACDYSFILDLAYAKVTLNNSQLKTFLAIFNHIQQELGFPSLLIYLQCSASTELERIQRRGRDIEKSITLDFLEQLNQSLQKCIDKIANDNKILIISSEKQNFVANENTKTKICQLIQNRIND